jgi:hypothetical protein
LQVSPHASFRGDQPHPALHLHLLLGPAKWLAREGQAEWAVELAALARHHPGSIKEARDKAGLLLDALRADLSPDVYAADQTRDLDETLQELLIELDG